MIPVFTAFKAGLKEAWKQKKMIVFLYLVNITVAYLLALPVSMILADSLDYTTAADKLLQAFDVTLFQTIYLDYAADLNLGQLLITYALFYLVLNTFFAGGILRIIIDGKGFGFRPFFSGCVEYFSRFLTLFLFSLVFFMMVFVMLGFLSALSEYFTSDVTTDFLPFVSVFLRLSFLVMLLAMINMLFDYAKIMTVVNDFYAMLDTTKVAVMYVMMSMRKTVSLYLLYLLTAILLFALYWFLESLLDISNITGITIFIILSQIYILSRIWIRLSFLAGQYIFYHHSNTAMPGMSREMLDAAVEAYEKRIL